MDTEPEPGCILKVPYLPVLVNKSVAGDGVFDIRI